MSKCPRVEARIECPECGYPASESYYYLPWSPSRYGRDVALEPLTLREIRDPGHKDSDYLKPYKMGSFRRW